MQVLAGLQGVFRRNSGLILENSRKPWGNRGLGAEYWLGYFLFLTRVRIEILRVLGFGPGVVGESALGWWVLLSQQLAPLRGSLNRSGAIISFKWVERAGLLRLG